MKILDENGTLVDLKICLRDKNGCFVLLSNKKEAEYVDYSSNSYLAKILLDGFTG